MTDTDGRADCTYDLFGNRLPKTDGATTLSSLYDFANQLTEIQQDGFPQATLTHDLRGNLSSGE